PPIAAGSIPSITPPPPRPRFAADRLRRPARPPASRVSRRGDRLPPQAARPDPARLGDVDHHAVRAPGPPPDRRVMDAGHPDAEGAVDVVAGLGPGRRQLLLDLLEVLDLEADVVDAAPVLAALHAGHVVVLEVENGQVEIAVAQVVAAGGRAVDPGDLLQAEDVHVELGRLLRILGRERDVLDLGHAVPPLPVRVDPRTCLLG